jgi:FAD/FMN-containing dehydrogenase
VVHGHLPDETTDAARAIVMIEALRDLAAQSGGQVSVERCEKDWGSQLSLWGSGRNDWRLMDAVKRQFDPDGMLSPGRGVDGALVANSEAGHD